MNARGRTLRPADHDTVHPRARLSVDEIHIAVAQRFGDDGIRYTRSRRAVVDALATANQPLTVDRLALAAGTPLSSVYRTIAILEAHALVTRLPNDIGDHARVELTEDLLGHHHHLACAGCGTMIDVTLPDWLEAEVEHALGVLAEPQDFTVERHRLDIIGTCATCKRSNGHPSHVVPSRPQSPATGRRTLPHRPDPGRGDR